MARDRFVNSALSELQEANRSPIYGYQHLRLMPLEEATETLIPLVPGVIDYVSTAKNECNRNTTLLTWDESAAIYLYTMPIPFFSLLNETLRAEDRHALQPWFAFLKLFITALQRLPSIEKTVWRGVSGDFGTEFDDGYVHTWWSVNSCSPDISVVEHFLPTLDNLDNSSTLFAIDAIHAIDISAFSKLSEQEIVLIPGTRLRAKAHSLSFEDRFFLVHLEEETSQSESQSEQNYLSKLLKQEYQRHCRIERIMNPSKSFPIEQSYINLAIVETKEQQEKEKKLLNANHNNEIIGTFEEIYGTKTKIEIKSIFEKCNDHRKNILVLGRAGIGKTTFCRYVAYQWATGAIWQQYQLIIFIRLRNLTESRYPPLAPGTRYSLIDLVKTEYFYHGLSEEYERLLKEDLNKSQVLWLLDGHDEIAQNIPAHLQYLLEQLLKTPHHVLTSRPYLNTLSYNVQLEITGFTDDNIKEYVKQFFNQIKDEMDNAPLEAQKLLSFFKFNPRIWGIVHIPFYLELTCSHWCNTDWSERTTLTMTTMHDKMIEWLCRRHLEKQKSSSNQIGKEDVYTHLDKGLALLESLAFNGMESKSIILPPKLLQIASIETKCPLQHQSPLLNIGILKSLDYKPIGTCIEAEKNHYFVHLSFQEYFAARYLVRALNGAENQKKKAIDFIKAQKYNQRFEFVLTFASGLLIDRYDNQCMNLFWQTLLGEPQDLIGLRHVQIVISCLEEAGSNTTIPQFRESINLIIKWINYFVSAKHDYSYRFLSIALQRSPSLINRPEILHTFVTLYNNKDPNIKANAIQFISSLPISNSHLILTHFHLTALDDHNIHVRCRACQALGEMGEKAATDEVLNRLLLLLVDTDDWVRHCALEALGNMGEKAATNEVLSRLLPLLVDTDNWVRRTAREALGKIGGKEATNEVLNRLLPLLVDTDDRVRDSACQALGKMGEKAATNEVIIRLLLLLGDTDLFVRNSAYEALAKMGEKAAANEVINRLLFLLGDTNYSVRSSAYKALGKMGEKVATNEVINRLLPLLDDTNHSVRNGACQALGKIGEKAATNEVINRLLLLLGDTNDSVKSSACEAFGKIGEKAATNEVINRLSRLLGDTDCLVRNSACEALGEMGEKAATNHVINRLFLRLGDRIDLVRNSASKVLGKIGSKAATNEVINRLVTLLDDTNYEVRKCAISTLETMGEEAETHEVLNRLVTLLGDTVYDVSKSAYRALTKMSEKAATKEVINRLLILLCDKNDHVRMNACWVLETMGKKAATDEIIDRLVILVGDTDDDVRNSACSALKEMGKKAATNEVINRLLLLLGDTKHSVRISACKVLGNMGENGEINGVIDRLLLLRGATNHSLRSSAYEALGSMYEKAVTNEVINRLLLLLGDTDDIVRHSACKVLGKMGEKVATNEVINRLSRLLGDTDCLVRNSACEALGEMGEKTASNEVINRLLLLLGETNNSVRSSACAALGKMGEKAATNEVLNRLLLLLGETNNSVRSSAYEALWKMGEKAATKEVINRLLLLLGETNDSVRSSAYEALRKMGETAVTNERINRFLFLLGDTNYRIRIDACKALKKCSEIAGINKVLGELLDGRCDNEFGMRGLVGERAGKRFAWLPCAPNLEEDIDEEEYVHHYGNCWFTKNSFLEEFIRVFLHTNHCFWLPIITRLSIDEGYGITVSKNTVVVYGSKDPVPLRFTDEEVGQRLLDYLFNWPDKSLER